MLTQKPQKMSRSQGPVSFKDVAVGFTQEEWQHLEPVQRRTYQKEMLENYNHLAAMGSDLSKPRMIVKLELGEEPWLVDSELPCLSPLATWPMTWKRTTRPPSRPSSHSSTARTILNSPSSTTAPAVHALHGLEGLGHPGGV